MPAVVPITLAPPAVLEVTPGPLFLPERQGKHPSKVCDFRPGSVLAGRYQIQEEIGRGGFSVVYRALDQTEFRQVAIKRIQLNQLSARQIIDATETFNREVATLPLFKAVPGVPAYYTHLTDTENWYLVTRYIEGQTLEDYLQQASGGYLAEKETLELGLGLADLVHTLHTSKPQVIFRDLKPANIMYTPDNRLFLIDFGIARFYTPGKKKDTTPLGSPGYAPPEQYGSAQTDQRSDIYSLGATLQTLLTGRDLLELREGQPSRNPTPPSRGLRKLLAQMLASEAAQRPKDMLRVKRQLEYIFYRPFATGFSGLIASAVYCLFWQFSHVTLFGSSSTYLLNMAAMAAAVSAQSFFLKRYHLPQQPPRGFWRFYWLGILAGALPFLVWHLLFGWPF